MTIANRFQKFFGGLRSRRFCKSRGGKLPAVIVGAAYQDFFPRFRVRQAPRRDDLQARRSSLVLIA